MKQQSTTSILPGNGPIDARRNAIRDSQREGTIEDRRNDATGNRRGSDAAQNPIEGTVDDRRKAISDRRKAITDRRAAPRIRTLKGAKIIWPNGAPVSCVVRNLSESGASLEAYAPVLQNTFDLVFDLDHSRRSCRVVWRKEPRLGVKFQ